MTFEKLEDQHRNSMVRLRILRPSLTDHILRRYCNSYTWLLDTYLLMDAHGNISLYAVSHNGLGKRVGAAAWSLTRDCLGLWQRGAALEPDNARELAAVEVVLGSSNATPLGNWVAQQDLFWRSIAPLRDVHSAAYRVQLIRHHMVQPTLVTNPCAGFRNEYDSTPRAVRDMRYRLLGGPGSQAYEDWRDKNG